MIRPTRRRERGTASIELAALVPLILLAAMAALQLGVVGWTVVATGAAARDAARAATLGQSPAQAARGALPGILDARSVTGGATADSQKYTVTVPIPRLLIIDLGAVSRTAELPDIR